MFADKTACSLSLICDFQEEVVFRFDEISFRIDILVQVYETLLRSVDWSDGNREFQKTAVGKCWAVLVFFVVFFPPVFAFFLSFCKHASAHLLISKLFRCVTIGKTKRSDAALQGTARAQARSVNRVEMIQSCFCCGTTRLERYNDLLICMWPFFLIVLYYIIYPGLLLCTYFASLCNVTSEDASTSCHSNVRRKSCDRFSPQ